MPDSENNNAGITSGATIRKLILWNAKLRITRLRARKYLRRRMTVGAGLVCCILTPIAAWLWFDVAHESRLPGLGRRELRTHVHRYWCALLRNQRDHVLRHGVPD